MTFTDRERFIYGLGILRGVHNTMHGMTPGLDLTDVFSEISMRSETKLLPKNNLHDTHQLLDEIKEASDIVDLVTDTLSEMTEELNDKS